MTTPAAPRRRLPSRPSQEHLRKQAKRVADTQGLQLAAAQRQLAADYGHASWAALMRAVAAHAPPPLLSPLSAAAARGDVEAVRTRLAQGDPPEGGKGEPDTPLWHACSSSAPAETRIAIAGLLLDAGASPRVNCTGGATPLHAAAQRGPLQLVELLIRRGAFSWQGDARGRTPLHYARKGRAPDREQIIETLDRPVMRDADFRAAVAAIHAGDLAGLSRLLDRRPDLLTMRAIEPDCYPRDYFRDPKLFWFIANNPTLMRKVPANIAAIGRLMAVRGVVQADLDTTLELAMSAGPALPVARLRELMAVLLEAGAAASERAIDVALAHLCFDAVQTLLDRGTPLTAPIAAALGRDAELARLLLRTSPTQRQTALGMAVIAGNVEAARLCLDAGADANAPLPIHAHSRPLHQAALDDDLAMLELLVSRGADRAVQDTLWKATPLDWAVHNKKRRAEAYLRALPD